MVGLIFSRNKKMTSKSNTSPDLVSAVKKMDDYVVNENKKLAKAWGVMFLTVVIFFVLFMAGLLFYVFVIKPYQANSTATTSREKTLTPTASSIEKLEAIVGAIQYASSLMGNVFLDSWIEESKKFDYDKFTCQYPEKMVSLCQEIDISYGGDDNKEPIIAHSSPKDSQGVCIYSPLPDNEDGFRWFCAYELFDGSYPSNTEREIGFTNIDPGSTGYCVDGKTAICPPFVKSLQEWLEQDSKNSLINDF